MFGDVDEHFAVIVCEIESFNNEVCQAPFFGEVGCVFFDEVVQDDVVIVFVLVFGVEESLVDAGEVAVFADEVEFFVKPVVSALCEGYVKALYADFS